MNHDIQLLQEIADWRKENDSLKDELEERLTEIEALKELVKEIKSCAELWEYREVTDIIDNADEILESE